MQDFKNYKKPAKARYVTKTVSIRDDQAAFIKAQNINFSEFIRDYLDQAISNHKIKLK